MPCGLLLLGGDELWSLQIEREWWARHQRGVGEPGPGHQRGVGEPGPGAHALTLRVNLELVGEPHDVNEDLNRNPADLTTKFC